MVPLVYSSDPVATNFARTERLFDADPDGWRCCRSEDRYARSTQKVDELFWFHDRSRSAISRSAVLQWWCNARERRSRANFVAGTLAPALIILQSEAHLQDRSCTCIRISLTFVINTLVAAAIACTVTRPIDGVSSTCQHAINSLRLLQFGRSFWGRRQQWRLLSLALNRSRSQALFASNHLVTSSPSQVDSSSQVSVWI